MDNISVLGLLVTLIASVFCDPTAEVVDTVSRVQGWKGEDIRLPCHFQGEPAAVAWVKESILTQPAPKAEFRDGYFESLEDGFKFHKNFSLTITDLKLADRARASRHIIEECVNRSQSSQNRCRYRPQFDATSIILTCVVSGFKPDISVMWTDESGERLQSVHSLQTTLSDNTYERFEKINVSVSHETEETFACVAIGDAVNGTSTKEITLLPISGSVKNNIGLIIGLYIGIPAAVLILFLLVRKLRQKRDQEFVPERVVEDLPPTVQTILNIEDESRKWYSVQWADFKLCCTRLKDVSSKHPRIPIYVYALYRFALAAYFFGFLITYVVLAGDSLGPKFVIYLAFWTYSTATCYVCLACCNAVMDLKKSRTNAALEGTCSVFYDGSGIGKGKRKL
ncbi:uncharacterized protein [Diadema setosum]|uniref:uncharacterized protein n=1 Tax=Diadema setosum TaxID=31175 RepID=UPI003B3B1EC4